MNGEPGWLEMNQRYLMEEVARVRRALETTKPRADSGRAAVESSALDFGDSEPPALERVAGAFGLSPFERDVLVLCAATELEGGFASLCGRAAGDPARPYPTFGLALAYLAEPHWSALAPVAPLRRWRLIEGVDGGTASLVSARLRIDERILHFLTGLNYLDERLAGRATPIALGEARSPETERAAEIVAARLGAAEGPLGIQLFGDDRASKRIVAHAAVQAVGGTAYEVQVSELPENATDREPPARLWEREAVLSSAVPVLDAERGASRSRAVAFAGELECPVILLVREPLDVSGRERVLVEVKRPAWQSPPARRETRSTGESDDLGPLAQRIEALATWEDLVLPGPQCDALREIAAHVRQAPVVYGAWGFATKSTRGLGISALFSGPSGTGKTMAAEVLANELGLDLYRIDLSAVVSKYIGETEKNLNRVFDAAEAGGAVLLFDEADALFGKRSEVKDSHDRYANIEISYLLQRMEAYRGLAVLATNLKSNMDPAFMRRIRFIIAFPFPDAAQREEIWRRVFPRQTPTAAIDPSRLARLTVTGGSIWNIAMRAAFLAADQGRPVGMPDLLVAARGEYAKLERPMSDAEFRGW